MRIIQNLVAGTEAPDGTRRSDLCDPNRGEGQAQVMLGGRPALAVAIAAARTAQPGRASKKRAVHGARLWSRANRRCVRHPENGLSEAGLSRKGASCSST